MDVASQIWPKANDADVGKRFFQCDAGALDECRHARYRYRYIVFDSMSFMPLRFTDIFTQIP